MQRQRDRPGGAFACQEGCVPVVVAGDADRPVLKQVGAQVAFVAGDQVAPVEAGQADDRRAGAMAADLRDRQ